MGNKRVSLVGRSRAGKRAVWISEEMYSKLEKAAGLFNLSVDEAGEDFMSPCCLDFSKPGDYLEYTSYAETITWPERERAEGMAEKIRCHFSRLRIAGRRVSVKEDDKGWILSIDEAHFVGGGE